MVGKRKGGGAESGVAMTEFALVLPVFIAVVVGLLGFGRALYYWIEANHLANETVRWAVVDRNPACPTPGSEECKSLQKYAREGSTNEFGNATVCILLPPRTSEDGGVLAPPSTPQVGDPLEVEISKRFSFVDLPYLDVGTITIRGSATMRIERFAAATGPTTYKLGCGDNP